MLNAQRYNRQVFKKVWTGLKQELGGDTEQLDQQCYAQDGTTGHMADSTGEWLRVRFGTRRLNSRREVPIGPAKSLHLTTTNLLI